MAQILLENKNEADTLKGDIVDTFEHDKWFPPNIYESFDVLAIPGFTKAEIDVEFKKKVPEKANAYKSETVEWTTKRPKEKELWKKDGEWYFLEESPGLGYGVTLSKMSDETRASLESEEVTKDIKCLLIASTADETISRIAANLNKVDKLIEA